LKTFLLLGEVFRTKLDCHKHSEVRIARGCHINGRRFWTPTFGHIDGGQVKMTQTNFESKKQAFQTTHFA